MRDIRLHNYFSVKGITFVDFLVMVTSSCFTPLEMVFGIAVDWSRVVFHSENRLVTNFKEPNEYATKVIFLDNGVFIFLYLSLAPPNSLRYLEPIEGYNPNEGYNPADYNVPNIIICEKKLFRIGKCE